jgi:hypothetical protein
VLSRAVADDLESMPLGDAGASALDSDAAREVADLQLAWLRDPKKRGSSRRRSRQPLMIAQRADPPLDPRSVDRLLSSCSAARENPRV